MEGDDSDVDQTAVTDDCHSPVDSGVATDITEHERIAREGLQHQMMRVQNCARDCKQKLEELEDRLRARIAEFHLDEHDLSVNDFSRTLPAGEGLMEQAKQAAHYTCVFLWRQIFAHTHLVFTFEISSCLASDGNLLLTLADHALEYKRCDVTSILNACRGDDNDGRRNSSDTTPVNVLVSLSARINADWLTCTQTDAEFVLLASCHGNRVVLPPIKCGQMTSDILWEEIGAQLPAASDGSSASRSLCCMLATSECHRKGDMVSSRACIAEHLRAQRFTAVTSSRQWSVPFSERYSEVWVCACAGHVLSQCVIQTVRGQGGCEEEEGGWQLRLWTRDRLQLGFCLRSLSSHVIWHELDTNSKYSSDLVNESTAVQNLQQKLIHLCSEFLTKEPPKLSKTDASPCILSQSTGDCQKSGIDGVTNANKHTAEIAYDAYYEWCQQLDCCKQDVIDALQQVVMSQPVDRGVHDLVT